MKNLVVTDLARSDLTEIAAVTEQRWGKAQKRKYVIQLREQFKTLCRHPEMGINRKDIGGGYRSIPIGSHVIFYRDTEFAKEIIRVLHERMDIHQIFPDKP